MNRSKKIIIGVAVVVVVGFLAGKAFLSPGQQSFETVKRGDVVEAAYGVGTVKSDRNYVLKTGVNSRVIKRFVTQGEHVKKGDALIQLDGLPLYRAPFDGVISSLSYNEGEVVFSQTSVLTLVNLEKIYMQLSMDERTIGGIREGQEARISFEGQRKATLVGSVRAVYSNDGEFLIDINFDPKDLTLLPGMTADVAIQIAVHKNKLLVPVASLNSDKITLLKDHPEEIQITVGANDGKYAVVESGAVNEGDRILLKKAVGGKQTGMP